MAQKARGPSRKKHRKPAFAVGTPVVNPGGELGVDPFTTLVVVDVHQDGTVDVARFDPAHQGGAAEWDHVSPRVLIAPQ